MKATATEVKTRFGEFLDKARREPVVIERSGREVAVLLAVEDYEQLQWLEDQIWGERALAAAKEGMVGEEGVRQLLARLAAMEGAGEE